MSVFLAKRKGARWLAGYIYNPGRLRSREWIGTPFSGAGF